MASIASPEFRDWFENKTLPHCRQIASRILKVEEIDPVMLVFGIDGEVVPVPLNFQSNAHKTVAFDVMRDLAGRIDQVAGVVLVSEVWVVSKDLKTPEERAEHERLYGTSKEGIANHPDRTEAVMWNCCRGDMQLIAKASIITCEETGNRTLGETTIFDPVADEAVMTGRMIAHPVNQQTKQ